MVARHQKPTTASAIEPVCEKTYRGPKSRHWIVVSRKTVFERLSTSVVYVCGLKNKSLVPYSFRVMIVNLTTLKEDTVTTTPQTFQNW